VNYRQIRCLPWPRRSPPVPASGKLPSRARAHPLPGIRAAICAQERTRSLGIVSTTRLSMGAERRIRIRL